MQRYSKGRTNRQLPSSCSCLVDALRTFPASADHYTGCAAPSCPLKDLDGRTLQQFLEAIAGAHDAGGGDANLPDRNGKQIRLLRTMARRRLRPSSR
jgi:hypothetical protein